MATIGSPVGLKGEVNLNLQTDQPENRLQVGCSFLNGLKIRSSRKQVNKKGTRWIIGFEGLSKREDVELRKGEELLIEVNSDEDTDTEFFFADLVGLKVLQNGQNIGKVVSIIEGPAQDLLEIEIDLGSKSMGKSTNKSTGKKVLVPFVRQIVPIVDIENDFLEITPPDGLFDID